MDITSAAYATRWYITMFTGGVVKYHTLLRIWDIYFLEGFNIFYFVAIALLKTYQRKLFDWILKFGMFIPFFRSTFI